MFDPVFATSIFVSEKQYNLTALLYLFVIKNENQLNIAKFI
jgi:hypothetical protein